MTIRKMQHSHPKYAQQKATYSQPMELTLYTWCYWDNWTL